MWAVLINGGAALIGGFLGLLLKKIISKETSTGMLKSVGLVVIILALWGALAPLFASDSATELLLLLVITLVAGVATGELLKIHDHIERLDAAIEKKFFPKENGSSFSKGFIAATLIYCTGAMSIVGGIEAATGAPETYYLKALIDGVTAIALASTLGFGVIFAFIPVVVYQGLIVLVGSLLAKVMPVGFTDGFAIVGYALVLAIGINFLLPDEKKIKVTNMLPALLFVIAYYLIFK